MDARAHSSDLPETVGPYRIVGRLGVGGMGVVYAGVDAAGTRAAVKLIHPAHAQDEEFLARFAREVGVLRRVGGLCTAKVLGSDIGGGSPWVATEYVPGPTLERRAQDGPLSGDELYGVAAGLAEALTAMHAAGVVHRDLKPSNVILSPAGPRVVDFGIAKLLDHTSLTSTGTVIGSPGWVSPEEYRGEEAGTAADVYGWGLLACFAATGLPPYGRGRPEVLVHRVLNEAPDSSAVPGELREIVDRALSKDPGSRPTASELLDSVASRWRAAGEEPPSPAAESVTRLLTRTWIAPAAPEPAWTPPPKTPPKAPPVSSSAWVRLPESWGQARTSPSPKPRWGRVAAVVAASVVAVAVTAAGVLTLQPSRKSADEIAELAAARSDSVYALRFTTADAELTITPKGFAKGKMIRNGQEVQLLRVPTGNGLWQGALYKAPASYWLDHDEAIAPRTAVWSGSEALRQAYADDYADQWITSRYLDDRGSPARVPLLFWKVQLGLYSPGKVPLPAHGIPTDTTVGGRPAVKIPYVDYSYYVSRAEPHRIIRYESDTESYDVTEITGAEATAFAAALRDSVAELRTKSLTTNVWPPTPEFQMPCTASTCSSTWSVIRAWDSESSILVTNLYESLGDQLGERLGGCRKPFTLRGDAAKVTCEVKTWKWRSWFNGSPGGKYEWRAYVLQRVLDDREVTALLEQLD